MSINKIWICDDDEKLRLQWEGELAELGLSSSIEHVDRKMLAEAVRELENRRLAAVGKLGHKSQADGAAYLDGVNVLIVDYDLLELEDPSYLTGENVAYFGSNIFSV